MSEATYHFVVRHEMEWAECFVHDYGSKPCGDGVRYSVSWCCVSSYGVFGHNWTHMGSPFAEFIKKLDPDYLKSKIAHREFSQEVMIRGLKRRIIEARREQQITKDEAREAREAIAENEADYSGYSLATKLYEEERLFPLRLEWCDIETQDWSASVNGFVKSLWPQFVKKYRSLAAESTTSCDR